jgi:hypothetical protein
VNTLTEIASRTVLTVVPDEPTLGSENAAVDVIGQAFDAAATVVVVPADRVVDEFFTLSTRVAGDVLVKFTNYQILLVIRGDISPRLAASDNFRAFVHEANRGKAIWFVTDDDELAARLVRQGVPNV